MVKATIIMPHYSESEEVVFDQLQAWNLQQSVDLKDDYEFIIVTDGPHPEKDGRFHLSEEFLKSFKNINIKHIKLDKNQGPGMARQRGINEALGMYVTCCDIDDMITSSLVLHKFETTVMPQEPDMAHFGWQQAQIKPDGEVHIGMAGVNLVWMFGKFIKRSFIERHNVKFDDQIMSNEDGSFLQRLACYEPKQMVVPYLDLNMIIDPNTRQLNEGLSQIPFPMYLWRTAERSITRQNNAEYALTCKPEFMIVKDSVLDVMKSKKQEAAHYLTEALINCYYTNNEKFEGYTEDFIKTWTDEERRLAGYLLQKYEWLLEDAYGKDYLNAKEWKQKSILISQQQTQMAFAQDKEDITPTISLNDWMALLKEFKFDTLKERPQYMKPNFNVIKNDNIK